MKTGREVRARRVCRIQASRFADGGDGRLVPFDRADRSAGRLRPPDDFSGPAGKAGRRPRRAAAQAGGRRRRWHGGDTDRCGEVRGGSGGRSDGDRSWRPASMRLPRIWKRCASGSARHCEDSGQRLSPRGGGSEKPCWVGRVGFAGDAVNPSLEAWPPLARVRCPAHTADRVGRPAQPARGMPRAHAAHALHGLPTTPSTVSCGRPPRKKERRATAGRALRLLGRSMAPLYRKHCWIKQKDAANAASFCFFSSSVTHALAHRHRETVEGGTGRLAGPLAPWMAPSSPMDGFTACPASRPRPATISDPEPLWLLMLMLTLPAAGGPPRVSAAPPHPTRSGSSRRCRRCRSSRSDSSPGTAGGSPRRSSTPVPGTRSRW